MKRLQILVSVSVIVLSMFTASVQAGWNLANDYSLTANDTSVAWQRGYLGGEEGSFNSYNTYALAVSDTLVGWCNGGNWDSNGNAVKNISSSDYDGAWGTYYVAGQVTLMAGTPAGPWTCVRWLAPDAGYYAISAAWTNQREGGTDVTVSMRNTATGTTMLENSTAPLTEYGSKFNYVATLYLTAGQNIDFIVQSAGELPQVAGLDATITAVVPEPAALTLLGLSSLLTLRRRKG